MSNGNQPAYPIIAEDGSGFRGMTKREVFAMAAMQGLCTDRHESDLQGEPKNIAYLAVQCADELLKALEQ